MMFTDEQIQLLNAPLDSRNVKTLQGNDYIEGWHAIAEANRIFGHCGWSYEIVQLEQMSSHTNKNGTMVVGYICRVRVTVGGVTREDTGYDTGMSKTDVSACHEGASKGAVTDALKRALRSFGNQFGLALYDKLKTNVETDADRQRAANAPKPRRSKADSNEDYKRIQKEIDDAPTLAALGDVWKAGWPAIKTMPVDYEDSITQRKDDRKNDFKKQAAA